MGDRKGCSQRFLDTLDRVLFINADLELPPEPGVYFVTTKGRRLMYIGMSLNVRNRWKHGHHRMFDLLRGGAHYIYFQYTTEPADLEQMYIEEYDPPYNLRFTAQ